MQQTLQSMLKGNFQCTKIYKDPIGLVLAKITWLNVWL